MLLAKHSGGTAKKISGFPADTLQNGKYGTIEN